MPAVEQLIVALSVLFAIAGSSDVFGSVGGSVQLNINEPVSEFNDFFWVFNGSVSVLKYNKKYKDITPNPRYEDRVEFNEETCSLILKNLQKNDSGLYEVKASSAEKTSDSHYRLSVLDPVEAPVLTHQNSTDPCNSTITCTGHDNSINSSCYKDTCEEKEVTSSGGVALSLSVRGGSIICNHSNPVSRKQTAVEMKTFGHVCADEEPLIHHSRPYWPMFLILTAVFLGFLVLLAAVFYRTRYRRSTDLPASGQCENTIYATVETNDLPSPPETVLELPTTVYSVVKNKPQHLSTEESRYNIEIKKPVTASVTVESPKPESLYAMVTKTNKAVNED